MLYVISVMLFSVIYSVDIPKADTLAGERQLVRLADVKPPKTKRGTWRQTENSKSMGVDDDMIHAKWVAILDRKQFQEFVDKRELVAEDVQTMGSLGAPGFGFGWAPAISFDSMEGGYLGNAYVTPLVANRKGEPIRKNGANERDWARVRRAVLNVFGK